MGDEALPWLDAKSYYTRRWGEPVARVGIDGGFSCPNRGVDRTKPGCAFCAESGNRPPYQAGAQGLADQVRKGVAFQQSRYGFRKFSLYFQSYSSTWAPVETLRRTYDEALSAGSFVELTVGTRPDCIPPPVVDLLASYQNGEREVWVEMGLQSSLDATLARINRGHSVAAFTAASSLLRARDLPFTAHVMYGLPGEGREEFLDTVKFAIDQGASGLKFHDLILVPGSALHAQWTRGQVQPVDPEAYLDAAAAALMMVPPSVVVWRVCSDPENRKDVPAPGQKWPKNRFLNRLCAEIVKRRSL
jgi:radical SAM protein (TIGR01212 family)